MPGAVRIFSVFCVNLDINLDIDLDILTPFHVTLVGGDDTIVLTRWLFGMLVCFYLLCSQELHSRFNMYVFSICVSSYQSFKNIYARTSHKQQKLIFNYLYIFFYRNFIAYRKVLCFLRSAVIP